MLTVVSLIEGLRCPAWIVTSRPILGRCIPSFTKGRNDEDVKEDSKIFDGDETSDGEGLTAKKLLEALKKLAEILNLKEISEKIFSDLGNTWWMIVLGLLISMSIALLWIVLMK